jgi:hypothetical protein
MPYVGFEPTIPASKQAKTVHSSDRSATVTGIILVVSVKIFTIMYYILYVLLLNYDIVPTSFLLQPSELNDRFSVVKKNFSFLIFSLR